MDFQSLLGFLFLFLIFVLPRLLKQKKPPQQEPKEEYQAIEKKRTPPVPHPQRKPTGVPPVRRSPFEFQTEMDTHRIGASLDQHHLKSKIAEKSGDSLVSAELSKRIDLDPAYALKDPTQKRRRRPLLSRISSTRDLIIIHEIMNPPYAYRESYAEQASSEIYTERESRSV